MNECSKRMCRYCVMCADLKIQKTIIDFSGEIVKIYLKCFNVHEATLNAPWIPKNICGTCYSRLKRWDNGTQKKYFLVPALWHEVENHDIDCYFCVNYKKETNSKNSKNKQLKITRSMTKPVKAEDSPVQNMDVEITESVETMEVEEDGVGSNQFGMKGRNHQQLATDKEDARNKEKEEDDSEDENETEESERDDQDSECEEDKSDGEDINSNDYEEEGEDTSDEDNREDETTDEDIYQPPGTTKTHIKFSRGLLNDFVRVVNLSKSQSEVAASVFKKMRLLKKGVNVCFFRERNKDFVPYFEKSENLVYCHDIAGLFRKFGIEHDPKAWRLFIDASARSLKAVLLHNGNKLASIPIAHSTTLDESYLNIDFVLQKISYKTYKWKICTDLKMVTIILGQQSGFTKFPCFICLWDSRDRDQHYKKKNGLCEKILMSRVKT